jgi:hypothetical protein
MLANQMHEQIEGPVKGLQLDRDRIELRLERLIGCRGVARNLSAHRSVTQLDGIAHAFHGGCGDTLGLSRPFHENLAQISRTFRHLASDRAVNRNLMAFDVLQYPFVRGGLSTDIVFGREDGTYIYVQKGKP